jgi:hypothetical protein
MVADVPPAVMQIAQRTQREESGVVLYRLRRTFDVHAGPFRRHDELELLVAAQDGRTIKVRVIKAVTGGKAADEAGRASIAQQYEHPKAGDVFHRPFDARYAAEYTFESTTEPQTFRFTSTIHDASHGSGTFSTDASGNVVRYQYSPYTLPQYTSSGSITDQRSEVLPNYWALTREDHHYSGHYAIFGGGADVVIQYDGFKRFADVGSALSALQPYATMSP